MSKYYKKENNIEVVKITWLDAFSSGGTWYDPADIPDDTPPGAYITSIGYAVKDTDDGTWLTMGVGVDGRILAPFFIPQAMIKEMETINV